MEKETTVTPASSEKEVQQPVPAASGIELPISGEREPERAYSKEEMEVIIQKRISDELERTRSEAEKKALMTIEEREKAIAAKEEALRVAELKSAMGKLMEKEHMLPGLADFIDYSTEESMNESRERLTALFTESVNLGVHARFKTNSFIPPGSSVGKVGASPSDDSDGFERGLNSRT